MRRNGRFRFVEVTISAHGLTSTGLVPCGGDGWEAVEECSGVGGDGGVGGELVALDRDDR